MVDVKFIEEQLKQLAIRSREKAGQSRWTVLNEFIYRTVKLSHVRELTETVLTKQTTEQMLSNLKNNLDLDDFKILEKEERKDGVLLYIGTVAQPSFVGDSVLMVVKLQDNQVRIRIYQHDIPFKSIDTYDLMDYIAQTIVAPSKRSRAFVVNRDINEQIWNKNIGRLAKM